MEGLVLLMVFKRLGPKSRFGIVLEALESEREILADRRVSHPVVVPSVAVGNNGWMESSIVTKEIKRLRFDARRVLDIVRDNDGEHLTAVMSIEMRFNGLQVDLGMGASCNAGGPSHITLAN